jgi:hemerythrin-like domain-containing protein
VRFHVGGYVPLLRSHILKEDNVLYPMATSAIPAEAMERMSREFDEHERLEMGAGTHEDLHRLAERLIASYPPAETLAAEDHGCGCSGHAREAVR